MPPKPRAPTKKDLEALIRDMEVKLKASDDAERLAQEERVAAQAREEELAAQLANAMAEAAARAAAQAQAQAAEEQAQAAATAAAIAAATPPAQANAVVQGMAPAPAGAVGAVAVGAVAAVAAGNALIPQPTGVGWSLPDAMDLPPDTYREIQRYMHECVVRAGLEFTKDYRSQDPLRLGQCIRGLERDRPILQQYENHWAAAGLIRQFLGNRRRTLSRQGVLKTKVRNENITGQQRVARARKAAAAAKRRRDARKAARQLQENIDPMLLDA